MKCEFEKLIGRQIPNGAYLEIEEAYMKSEKDKTAFTAEWTPEKIDSLICKKYFEMEMKVLEVEAKVSGYQNEILRNQSRQIQNNESMRTANAEIENLWDEISKRDSQIENLENEIKNLKAKLYDKGLRKGT